MVLLLSCASLTVTTMHRPHVHGFPFHFITEKLQVTSQNAADLYHLTGLIHISEVSWDLVQDVRDFLKKGEEVRAKVISIDR
jgi:hypothetical protein